VTDVRVRNVIVARSRVRILGDDLIRPTVRDPAELVEPDLDLERPEVQVFQDDPAGRERQRLGRPVEFDRLIELVLRLGQLGQHVGQLRGCLLAIVYLVLDLPELAGQYPDLAAGLVDLAGHGHLHVSQRSPRESVLHLPQFVQRFVEPTDR